MTFLGLFGSKKFDHEEFERQLSALSRDIAKVRNQITLLLQKQASVRSSVVIYLTVVYVAVVAYRYHQSSSGIGMLGVGKSTWQVFLMCLLTKDLMVAFLTPFAIAGFAYMVDRLFKWWIYTKERSLNHLVKRHREKLEELKQATNFTKTTLLLQRFDSSVEEPPQKNQGNSSKPQPKSTSVVKGNSLGSTSSNVNGGNVSGSSVRNLDEKNEDKRSGFVISKQESSNANMPTGWAPSPLQKGIQDRILDYIIGSEHNETVESRHALICAKCYTHNGLAPPGCTNPFSIVYFCRNCSFMNGIIDEKIPAVEQGLVSNPIRALPHTQIPKDSAEAGVVSLSDKHSHEEVDRKDIDYEEESQ